MCVYFQFALINTVHTTIMDVFPNFFRIGFRPSYLMAGLCLLNFLLGLTMCTPVGDIIVSTDESVDTMDLTRLRRRRCRRRSV